ncbi:hypothetical protein AVEN_127955-1 [Araneus ventricosus]|uniref:Uncharacterized protein n=1 Tax=Araneus ventricosus TaxID=182803 RepID=A0A4Y1ZZ93_ARAVE|nr:hypothetical protein AVEN_127955-1 [Araneus ventricosus]
MVRRNYMNSLTRSGINGKPEKARSVQLVTKEFAVDRSVVTRGRRSGTGLENLPKRKHRCNLVRLVIVIRDKQCLKVIGIMFCTQKDIERFSEINIVQQICSCAASECQAP